MDNMDKPIRILIVEDKLSDVELALHEIHKVFQTAEHEHVETPEAFLEALERFHPDIVISDYSLPSFDGHTVIRLTKKNAPLTPVIICTGTLDEETAAEMVKAGAVDYVIKENILRLRHAILLALEKKQIWQERIDAERKLRESEERYRLISTVTSDYMFTTIVPPERNLDLNWVAGAFEIITGYTIEEYKAIGGWRATIFKDDIEKDRNDFAKLLANEQVISEIRIVRKDGEVIWVKVYAHPVWDKEKNELHGIYGAVQDISERKKAEEEIHMLNKNLNKLVKERTKQLELLNYTKDKFFSIIAHDLKGPIAAIIASTEMMIRTLKVNPDDRDRLLKYSENMLRSTQEGYKLLENLLEWSRCQTGAIKCEPQVISLSEIVMECISGMKLPLNNKNISIVHPEEPHMVFADKNMLGVIIRNLITNAVKYSLPGGTIAIAIKEKDKMVLTEIKDYGVGIAEDTKSKLFKIENKCSTLGTQKEKGTGLGLILCKEFIDHMGGEIWVESEEGKGSTFSFTLPVKEN
jgi:PAS domain S-box-containing protein